MNYEKNVNRLLNWLSEKTEIPKESLHLLNITPELLDQALTRYVDAKIPLHRAEDYIKAQWHNASPITTEKPISEKELELLGFNRVDNTWKHKITDQVFTNEQIKIYSFKQIEESILRHPFYHLHQLHKEKFEANEL